MNLTYPVYFPEPLYAFEYNPLSHKKIELGRILFYDPLLSKDGSISCSSCHSPYNAFAHTDHDLSHGIFDQMGMRNAPALFNLAWQPNFMWDGAIHNLELQALAPIGHPAEMGESIQNVVKKLNESAFYRDLFLQSFGDSVITSRPILKSLAQFQLSLVSANAKYDQVKKGKLTFTEQEERGYQIFKANCNSCHKEPLFSTYKVANNGLTLDPDLMDYGKYASSSEIEDSLLFKIPSLRNLSYTYPYMHDGRFDNVNEVLQHYTKGIANNSFIAEELKGGVILSTKNKIDLKAFLLTLDDKTFVFDSKHSFPKKLLLEAND